MTQPSFSLALSEWDTQYFKMPCAKAVLHYALSEDEVQQLCEAMREYSFVSVQNKNCDAANAHWIGQKTTAFLADVNIQFEKQIGSLIEKPGDVAVDCGIALRSDILDMADFQFSKFIEDEGLRSRGGAQVYRCWLENAFGRQNKYFSVIELESAAAGYALFSFEKDICTVELISVRPDLSGKGLGRRLMNSVEYTALEKGCTVVRVGTQGKNITAINFYHSCGYRQIAAHQAYHLWNYSS